MILHISIVKGGKNMILELSTVKGGRKMSLPLLRVKKVVNVIFYHFLR